MLIDAHNHPNWHGYDAGRILRNMDEHHIDRMWLLSWEVPEDEYDPSYHRVLPPGGVGIPLADVLAVTSVAPERFVPGYIPHPKRPDAIDRLRAAVEIHGIRLAGELKVRLTFDDPDALRLYAFCGERKLPITIHLDYPLDHGQGAYPRPNWWYGGSIEALARAMRTCPETIFVGHGPGFWAHVSADGRHLREAYPTGPIVGTGRLVELMREFPSLWADLSAGSGLRALQRDRGHALRFVDEFQDRLMFARDYFDGALMDFLVSLELPAAVMAKLTHANALRLLDTYPAGG